METITNIVRISRKWTCPLGIITFPAGTVFVPDTKQKGAWQWVTPNDDYGKSTFTLETVPGEC